MKRRTFVGSGCGALAGALAGCFAEGESTPPPELGLLEISNHRTNGSYDFTVEIDDGEEILFRETPQLGPAGSGNESVVFTNPVEPGEYTVRVDVEQYSVSANTRELISDAETCLILQVYLDAETLHLEPRRYARCNDRFEDRGQR